MTSNDLSSAERSTPFLGDASCWEGMCFGLGLLVVIDTGKGTGRATTGQFGWPGCFGTCWFAVPERDLCAILLFQEYWGRSSVQADFQELVDRSLAQ